MSDTRVLLIHDDPLLAGMYREKLELNGFAVEQAENGSQALTMLSSALPRAIVLDAVALLPETPELIATLRAHYATRDLPIIVLPTQRGPLSEAAQTAGATALVPRGLNPMAELIDTLQTAIGENRTATAARTLAYLPDGHWLQTGLENAPELLNVMRRELLLVSRDPQQPGAVRPLFQLVHRLTEQMALLGQKPLLSFASGLEALVLDLHRFPEQINATTLRTVCQSLDFLSTLLTERYRPRLIDPTGAQVLIIDDEDGARQVMLAAMKMAHLKPLAAGTPAASLTALTVQPFDLVFIDIGLPEVSGFELCTKIRMLRGYEKTPIVFITGMTSFQNRVQSSLCGGHDFVGKPFNLPELGLKALMWLFKAQMNLV